MSDPGEPPVAIRSSPSFFVGDRGPAATSAVAPAARREEWLKHGGALIVFPAGKWPDQQADRSLGLAWTSTMGRMVLATGATVVPAFIAGRNSTWFYVAGRLHASFRAALLARELLRMPGQDVRYIWPPLSSATCWRIDAAGLQSIRNAVDLSAQLTQI